jgi:hypothetical protein
MIILRTWRENKNEQRVFMGKPEGKRPPRRPGYRWEVNTKVDLGKIWRKYVKWMNMV